MSVPTEALNWKPAVGGLFRLILAGLPSGKICFMRLWLALYMAWDKSLYSRSLFLSTNPSTRYNTYTDGRKHIRMALAVYEKTDRNHDPKIDRYPIAISANVIVN